MRQSLAIFSFVESGITHLMTGVAEQNIFYFQRCSASASPFESLSLRKTKQVRGIEKSMPFVFHAIRQTCLSGRHGKQKIAVCGLLRSARLARAPAASRRERARGAERTASKAWPITENFTRKQIQIVSRVSESGAEMNFTPAHSTYFHTKVLSYRKENSIFVLRKNVCL